MSTMPSTPYSKQERKTSQIKTHGRESAAKKVMWLTSVLFTRTTNLPFSTLHISITTRPIPIKFTYFMYIHTNFEENQLRSLQDICMFLKIAQFSSHFLLCTDLINPLKTGRFLKLWFYNN